MSPSYIVLRRYPCLLEHLPIKCLCGAEMVIRGEYRDERFVGIDTEPCEACNAPAALLVTHLDAAEMAEAAESLRGAISSARDRSKP